MSRDTPLLSLLASLHIGGGVQYREQRRCGRDWARNGLYAKRKLQFELRPWRAVNVPSQKMRRTDTEPRAPRELKHGPSRKVKQKPLPLQFSLLGLGTEVRVSVEVGLAEVGLDLCDMLLHFGMVIRVVGRHVF